MAYKDTSPKKSLDTQVHNIINVAYQEVWDFQMSLHTTIKEQKIGLSKLSTYEENKSSIINHIILCEHLPVYTFGTSAKRHNLIRSESELEEEGFELHDINRGGDITYHGQGQVTGYLILDVELLYRDIHRYVSNIELAIILLLRDYGLNPVRLEGYTGVWISNGRIKRKICAIGVHLSRWVSLHGFGFNVCTDLEHFSNIIPCGISDSDKEVTSLSIELGRRVEVEEVRPLLLQKLKEVFNFNYINQ